jgi:tetratricopeptide (TPR) repeat protein
LLLSALLASTNEAQVLADMGKLPEAAAALDQTLEQAERNLAARPQDANLRYLVASTRLERVFVAVKREEPAEIVESALAKAVGELQSLVEDFPKTASRRRRLAEALTTKARWELKARSLEAASADAARAIELLEKLEREEASPAVYQPLLAEVYWISGEIALKRGQPDAAKAALLQARQRYEQSRALNPDHKGLAEEQREVERLLEGMGF